MDISKWVTQVRKGYFELCILILISQNDQLCGTDILSDLKSKNINISDGTIYPLLNRLAKEKFLTTEWELENVQGNPKKYYRLTEDGASKLVYMIKEYKSMIDNFQTLNKK